MAEIHTHVRVGSFTLVNLLSLYSEGVDYNSGKGAFCPVCGRLMKVKTTRAWRAGTRIRYHRCQNTSCAVFVFSVNVKSVQSLKPKKMG